MSLHIYRFLITTINHACSKITSQNAHKTKKDNVQLFGQGLQYAFNKALN